MNYLLFGHAGSANHGCEAIVRSTLKILGNNQYYLQSKHWEEDLNFELDELVTPVFLNEKEVRKNSPADLFFRAKARLGKLGYDELILKRVYKQALIKDSIALSVGGDNYCYTGIINELRAAIKALQTKEIPTVLWGCSVDRSHLDARTIEDLKSYRLITARESETIETLRSIGIEETVVPCTDPAFTLEKQEVGSANAFFEDGEVIGINVSDFMKYYNAYPDATFLNFKNLIDYILKETHYKIALIPHVRQPNNDDLVASRLLSKQFLSDRIWVVDGDLNCMELKYIISKCTLFVGCRTHSTIAAYSTCVPTLVVGYSVKARGICKDIFGRTENLLTDARTFQSDHDLTNLFLSFREEAPDLKKRLIDFMPIYIQNAYPAGEAVKNLRTN